MLINKDTSYIYKKVLSQITLVLFSIMIIFIIYLYADSIKYDLEIMSISIVLFIFIIYIILTSLKDFFSVKVFFSFLYIGFAFSGFYFSYNENLNNARFLMESGIDFNENDLTIAFIYILFAYVFFILGVIISSKIKVKGLKLSSNILLNNYQLVTFLAYIFFFIGFIYWLYLSFYLVGGPLQLLQNLGTYEALYKNKMSTLPYNFSYLGAYLLLLIQLENGKIKFGTIVIILLSFIMVITKGRLTGSILYLSSFIMIYLIYIRVQIKFKHLLYICFVFLFLIGLYFLRYYSNILYNGIEIKRDLIELGLYLLVGRGNIGDFQSMILAQNYIDNNNLLYGSTFFDYFRFWIDKIPGINLDMTSTGIRLKEYYFKDMSGAPAPSIISELLLNFGREGILFGMLIITLILVFFGKFLLGNKNILNVFLYVKFLIFVFLLPKVDSTAVSAFVMGVLPIIIFILVLHLLVKLLNQRKNNAN